MNRLLLPLLLISLVLPSLLVAQELDYPVENVLMQGNGKRHALSFSEGEQQLNVCNLEIGKTYTFRLLSNDPKLSLPVFENIATESKKSDQLIQFKATTECKQVSFTNKRKTDKTVGGFLSIKCVDCGPSEFMEKMMGINTSSNSNATFLVQDVFIGGGCFDVTGASSSGSSGQIGTFDNGESSIDLAEGIILSSGDIANSHGPNNVSNATTGYGNAGGDPDLADLGGNNDLWDLAQIEFNFTPTVSQVSFQYVFASEEYCEYVGSQFNDVFGFFISGPGINGGFSNNGENIAVIPGNGAYVGINTVNHVDNTGFYVDNMPTGMNPSCNSDDGFAVDDIQFDGFTTVLTAIANVQPCQTYTIKLVIADRGDDIFDSAVFLKANSFNAGSTAAVTQDILGIGVSATEPYEGCGDALITFERLGDDLSEPFPVTFTVSNASTATAGQDYLNFPTTIVIPAGEASATLLIDILPDFIIEGTETIILELQNPCSCFSSSIEIYITEPPPLTVDIPDVYTCDSEETTIFPQVSGGVPGYTYQWSNLSTNPSITVTPTGLDFYSIQVMDACGQVATANFTIYATSPTATLSGGTSICQGNFDATVTIEFTGPGPFDLTYTVEGFTETITGIYGNPFELPVSLPGTYELVGVSTFGCPGEVSGTAEVTIEEVLVDVATTNISCFGELDGSIDLDVSGGTSPYTFSWNQGLPDVEDPDELEPGNYNVTITDDNGCETTANAEVLEPDELSIAIDNINNIDCSNPGNGSISALSQGGTGTHSYLWSSSDTTATVSGLSAGTYQVTVTDETGCSVTTEAEVTENTDYPDAVADAPDQLDCDNTTISISGNGSSSGSEFDYLWTTNNGNIISGADQLSPSVDEPGTYQLVVTNTDNGCTDTTEVAVTEDLTEPDVNAGMGGSLNCDITQITLDGSGSSTGGNYEYNWTTNNGNITNGANTLNPVVDALGDYILEVTNSENGCSSIDTVSVDQDISTPQIALPSPDIINCNNTEIMLDASSSSTGPDLVYQWTTSNGNIVSDPDSLLITIDQAGTYELTIQNTTNGCESSESLIVTDNFTEPTAVAGDPVELDCQTSSTALDGTGSSTGGQYEYEWTTTDGFIASGENTLNPTVEEAGTYTLIVTDINNGCFTEASVMVNENSNSPVADAIAGDILTCVISEVMLNGQGSDSGPGFSLEWSSQDGNPIQDASSLQPTVTEPGTYTLTVTNEDNGCVSTANVTVEEDVVSPMVDAGPAATLTCTDPTYTLDGSNSDTGAPFELGWSSPDAMIDGNPNAPTLEVNEAGTYVLTVENTDNGCISTASVNIAVDQLLPEVEAGPDGLLNCDISSMSLQGGNSSSGADYEFSWNTLSGNIQLDSTLTPIVSNAGVFELVITNLTNGCIASDTVTVEADLTAPTADAGPADVLNCNNESLSLDAGNSVSEDGISYTWSTNNGNILSGANTATPEVDEAGTYQVIITNTTNFCQDTAMVNITEDFELPIADAGNPFELNCQDPIGNLDGNGSSSGSNFTYEWTTTEGQIDSGADQLVPTISQGGLYTLVVTNATNGCQSTDEVMIGSSLDYPTAIAGPDIQLNCEMTSAPIQSNGSSAGMSFTFQWNVLSGNVSPPTTLDNPSVDNSGVFELVITDDSNGCISKDTVEVMANFEPAMADAGMENTLNCYYSSLDLNGSGSSQGTQYEYNWTTDDGYIMSDATTLTPQVNQPGIYQLQVLNTESLCEDIATVEILQDIEAPEIAIADPEQLTCEVTTITLDANASSTGNEFEYNWSSMEGHPINASESLTPGVTEPGTYQLMIFNEENGCSSEAQVIVDQNILTPQAEAGPTATITCIDPSVQLAGSSNINGNNIVFQWTADDGAALENGDTVSPSVDQPGTYLLTVTNTDNGCFSTDEVSIAIDTIAPSAEAGSADILTCSVTTIILDGSSSSVGNQYEYSWLSAEGNPIDNANTLTPEVSDGGTYQLMVINTENGCSAQDNVLVPVDTISPMLSIVEPGTLTCTDPTISISTEASADNPINFGWTTDTGQILEGANGPEPVVNGEGTYTLMVTNTFNDCVTTASVFVPIDTLSPVADAGMDAELTCANSSFELNGTQSSSENVSYEWLTDAGNITSGNNTPTPTINEAGVYTLVVTNLENGCQSEDEVFIDVSTDAPQITIAEPGVLTCVVDAVLLEGSSNEGNTPFEFTWRDSDGNVLGLDNPISIEVSEPGVYELTVLNPVNGCEDSEQVTVLQDTSLPTADAGEQGILTCIETQLTLDGRNSSSGSLYTYQWSTTNGNILGGPNQREPLVDQPGIYQLQVTNTFNGCTNTDEVEVIEVIPEDAEVAVTQPRCHGMTGTIEISSVNGGAGPYLYSINGGEVFRTTDFYTNLQAGSYEVVVQDINGCEYEEQVYIEDPAPVEINLETQATIQLGESYTLEGQVNIPPSEIASVSWTPVETLSCPDCLRTEATPYETTAYQLEVENYNGCEAIAKITLVVDRRPAIFIPNAFSPHNNDGTNDRFFIYAKDNTVKQVNALMIFNRWGESVFEVYNFPPNDPQYGWDGSHRGQKMNTAVFVYWTEIELIDGSTVLLKGDVNLID